MTNNYKYLPIEAFIKDDAPIDLINELSVDDFPIDVFPEDIQILFKKLNESLNYNYDVMAVTFMSIISTINGNKVKLKVKEGWISTTTFWFCVVGRSGSMKSPPIKFMLKPLRNIDDNNFDIYEKQNSEYLSELRNDDIKNKSKKPKFQQNIISDITLEGLYRAWNDNSVGMLMFRDELMGWLNQMNSYRKGSDKECWLEMYDNNSFSVNRATQDVKMVKEPFINVLGGVQPEIIKQLDTDNGLFQRILFTKELTQIHSINDNELNKEYANWYYTYIENCFSLFREMDSNIILTLPKDCLDEFIKYDSEYLIKIQNDENTNEVVRALISKLKTYIPRFALCLFVIDFSLNNSVELNIEHMKRAIRICDYFIKTSSYIVNNQSKNTEMSLTINKNKDLKTTIQDLDKQGFTRTEIANKLKISRQSVYRYIN